MKYFSFSEELSKIMSWMYIGLMLSTRCSYQILMKLEFSRQFRKIFKYKISWKSFYWEPSCSMRTDMAKLTVAFQNFANASKNCVWSVHIRLTPVHIRLTPVHIRLTPVHIRLTPVHIRVSSVHIRLTPVHSCSRCFVLEDFEQKQNTDIFFARN
jgi:hypothetical protein